MSALEVGIPSGYVVHNFTLQKYVRAERTGNSTLRNAESYNDKAVFYFEYVSFTPLPTSAFVYSCYVGSEHRDLMLKYEAYICQNLQFICSLSHVIRFPLE